MTPDVLIINSYAGSLVEGAKKTGLSIRGSMEDSGYGIAIQKLNFPDLRFTDSHPWPQEDLTNTMVIAHPPCAAFSNMNIIKEKRGIDTGAFDCHRRVMSHAFSANCASLAIESVTGALKAAAGEYAKTAEKWGYDHLFLLVNSCGFGVPQWRARVWTLFFRKDLGLPFYKFKYHPEYRSVGTVLNGEPASDFYQEKHQQYHNKKFSSAGFDLNAMLNMEAHGAFDKLAKEYFKDLVPDADPIKLKYVTGTTGLYRAGLPRKLNPMALAPVVLGFSCWYDGNRLLNQKEYQRIMGFPDNWQWPDKEGKEFLTYLSKGVCPPVATWILEQMAWNLKTDLSAAFTHSAKSGEVLDLQPNRKEVEELLAKSEGRWSVVNPPTLVHSKNYVPTLPEDMPDAPINDDEVLEGTAWPEQPTVAIVEGDQVVHVPMKVSKPKKERVQKPSKTSPTTFEGSVFHFRENSYDFEIIHEWHRYLEKLRAPNPSDVWLDVGGHIGAFACQMAKRVKRVYSFEPFKPSFDLLCQNVGANDLHNVMIYNEAVLGHTAESTRFFVNKGMNQGLHSTLEVRGRDVVEVEACNINEALRETQANKLKLDVEGGEIEILQGLEVFNQLDELIMEFHLQALADRHRLLFKSTVDLLKRHFGQVITYPFGEKTWTTYIVARRVL